MAWLKNWWIPLILSCSLTWGQSQPSTGLDSLDIERMIDFFDTLSYAADSGDVIWNMDSVILVDCTDPFYQLDDRLKLFPFKSARITYIMKINEDVRDTLWSYIDCYGGKQMVLTRNLQGRIWKKITDIKHSNRYIFSDRDSLGFIEKNELAHLIDSLQGLTSLKLDDFLGKIKMTSALLSQNWAIRLAGIGRVCGKSCLKLYIGQIHKYVWYWKHLILKTETLLPSGGHEVVEAVKIEVDIPLPDSLFFIPKRTWHQKQIKS